MILPHKTPQFEESEGIPTLPKEVMKSMFWIFMGFWVPVIPNGFSIYLGQKIISMVRKEPDTYTGEIFGWFAILFTLAQLAGWVYIFAVIMGWAPPPESTRPIMP